MYFKVSLFNLKAILIRNQRSLLSKKNIKKCLKPDSVCADRQHTPENLLNMKIWNFVDWRYEPSKKEEKSFIIYLIYTKGKSFQKAKSALRHSKPANTSNLILDALLGRARPKIC